MTTASEPTYAARLGDVEGGWRRAAVVVLVACAAAGCSRKTPATESAGDPDAALDGSLQSAPPEPTTAVTVPDAGYTHVAVAPVEARRNKVRRWSEDPALQGAAALLDEHFGAPRHSIFELQVTELTAGGRRAVVVMEAHKRPSDARPIVFVANESGVLWSHVRPVAGILPPVGPLAIAAAPSGRVALAVCDPPTNLVALRFWDDDGAPFADFQALALAPGADGERECGALSLLYWPGQGHVIVASRVGATRAQLVSESGSPRWGQGLDLGVRGRAGAVPPASLAADTDDTFVLVQITQPSAAEGSPFHALAFRYDTRGTPIWPAAVDLGALAHPLVPGERATLSLTHPGVRVTLPRSAGNAEVDVRPSGDVIPRARAPR